MGSPKYPDPAHTAQVQGDENRSAALFNSYQNPNTYGPWGQTENTIRGYASDPRTGAQIPLWNSTTSFSPGQQKLYDTTLQAQQQFGNLANTQLKNANSMLAKPLTQANLPDWQRYEAGPQLQEADPAYRQQMVDSIMQSHQRNVTPQRDAEAAKYAAQGMMPGSEMDYMRQRGYGDVDAEAGRGAFQTGGEEARAEATQMNQTRQAMMNNARQRVDQSNATRQSQWDMNLSERDNVMKNIMAMMGVASPTAPQASPFTSGQVNPFDIAGETRNKFSADQQAASAKMQGITSILGAFNPLSMLG